MSSSNRTSSKGGKTKNEKTLKTDKIDTGKPSGEKIVMKENPKSEDLKSKVQHLIEMTQRSEEEVCLALHDCNYDLQQAANMLYDHMTGSQWSVKKKKSRQPSNKQDKQTNDESANTEEWNENQGSDHRDKPRSKSGGPNYRRGGDGGSRGWRGREKQENERNLDPDSRNDFGRERRGRPGGSAGGRGGGRGGRGGGRGRYPPRGGNRNNSYNKPIDTWDNNNPNTWDNNTVPNTNPVEETWDDFPGTDEWSTEEYTGSLADTKIFTPSANVKLDVQMENQHEGPLDTASQQLSQTLQINQQGGQIPPQSPVPMVGTLNAAQTKYLNQLTQQNNDKYTNIQTFQSQTYENQSQQYNAGAPTVTSQGFNSTQTYGGQQSNTYVNSKYPVANNYGTSPEAVPSQQPLRTKTQRARVPPPSKIPSSAVEMPGDLNSSIGYLDVQFGAMDFMSDSSSFDGVVDQKYGGTNNSSMENTVPPQTANLDLSNTNQNSNLDAYSSKTNAQSSISSALTQNLSSVENIPTSDHVTGAGSYSVASRTSAANPAAQSSTPQAVLDMGKQTDGHSYTQNSTYNSYQSKSYNSTYNANQTTASSYQPSNSYVNSQGGSYNTPSGNNYQNSYSSATSYQTSNNSAAFPSITQANSYSGTNQSYSQNASQSVYGANAGLNNSSTYGNTSSASQYNNYSSAANKLKDTVYDGTNAVSTAQTATTTIVSSSTTLSLTQSTVSTTKTTTTTLAAKNSSNVVSNMPPGVAPPVMSTPYNMVQVPYYQQPLYSYEEMQLLQQRLPHMTTPFYDMSYQTPTTLAAVRDATLGNVGYSMSDGRFTRGDNNASPVPSTLSQQTSTQAGHQAQPILAGTAAPPYFFAATHFNTIPNYPFYQLPAVTNAHGTNSNSQYPKPGGYSSGYGAYDALSQTQDYTKGAYVGNTQGQKAASGNASSTGSTGNDLTAMYGKSHTALGKVNSYEKQGFHSGTPPPFTGTLHGSQNAGLAPSGTGYAPPVYIPAMAPHQQHHSTQLMHQPLHQDSSNNSGQRSQTSNQAKASGKQYTGSYWNQS
ncbi:protein lingerer isoform X2 [Harmonia axyridis]|uniref:protein lingerer isoform X2 n=1 Tax=Harmonia axyridis TaxID=115357 RepID=UPI001E2784C6|nr:protein lingerer isoform X2 [Harmonia axyridis]